MPLTYTIHPDHEAASAALAARLRELVLAKPRAVLALPSGNTPERMYAMLAVDPAPFSLVRVFALDEYLGLGADDPRSFAAFFRRHVFGPLGLGPERARVLDGRAADPEAEAAAYEGAIAASGGLDLTVLGLGPNGHIAFNEPAPLLQARTHVATLAPPAADVCPQGITMGVATLLSAPRVLLIATGEKKARAVRRMLAGPIDPDCPASLLQLHPAAEVFLDTAAAQAL